MLGTDPPLVEAVGITKRFGAVLANDRISFDLRAGEVHALLGENGAGKSTLTRILYGLSQADEGDLLVDGRPVRFGSPRDAMAAGIGLVTQEFALVGPMTVAENVVLSTVGLGPVDRGAARDEVVDSAARLGVRIDPDRHVDSLSVGERQRVEILKALHHGCRVLILDEPTAVLVPQDVEALFASVRALTADGIGVVFISHKLHEVVEIADRVTVLRRGQCVATRAVTGLDPRRIAAMMVGHAIDDDAVAAPAIGLSTGSEEAASAEPTSTVPALELHELTLVDHGARRLDGLTVQVAQGELVGVAGVSGNGQTELVSVLCAITTPSSGRISVGGRDVTALDPVGRIRAGLGRITEDRRGSVVPGLSVEQNLVLEDLDRFRRFGFTQRRLVREHACRLIDEYDIRAEPTSLVGGLSGGNVQKVLLARALDRRPTALVVAQPTRGLDVGAYAYVHSRLRELRDAGAGVLLISEDLDELLALADRIVVLLSGRIVADLPRADATPEAIGLLMTGQRAHATATGPV